MKFITENDLRALYKAQPFSSYDPKEGERLTPGARQFLIDRGINMYGGRSEKSPARAARSAIPAETASEHEKRWLKLKLEAERLRFLRAEKKLLASDVQMAQKLTALGRQLSLLALCTSDNYEVADLFCTGCAGMDEENFSQPLSDCVAVNDFCMQLEQAEALLTLAELRSDLRLLQLELAEKIHDEKLQEKLTTKLNQIINRLSQLICQTMGGRACQRNA